MRPSDRPLQRSPCPPHRKDQVDGGDEELGHLLGGQQRGGVVAADLRHLVPRQQADERVEVVPGGGRQERPQEDRGRTGLVLLPRALPGLVLLPAEGSSHLLAPRTAAPPLPPRKNKMISTFHLFSQLPPFHLQFACSWITSPMIFSFSTPQKWPQKTFLRSGR